MPLPTMSVVSEADSHLGQIADDNLHPHIIINLVLQS